MIEWLVDGSRASTSNKVADRGATDDPGTVEPKKRKDLVLLDADPLADIRNTSRSNAVILNGRLLGRTKLDQVLAVSEAAASKVKLPSRSPLVLSRSSLPLLGMPRWYLPARGRRIFWDRPHWISRRMERS